MNSNISSDVANSMVQNFKKSGQYAMLDIFILTPVDIGLILLNNLLFKGLASLIGIFALPIGVIIGIIFLMARILMMSACIPAIVYDDVPVFKAFVESIKTAPYRFKLLFSKYFFVGLFSLSFLMLFGLSTLGIGYVLGFAMILMMFRVLDLVGYYNIKGYRYYLDTQRVVEPAILG